MANILSETHVLKDNQKYFSNAHISDRTFLGIEIMYFVKQTQGKPYGVTTLSSQQQTSGWSTRPVTQQP